MSRAVKVLALLGVLAVLALGGAVAWFLRHPLAVDAWKTRRALAAAGLEKTVIEAPSGRLTLWRGGSGPALLLLHGAGDQAGAWARVAPALLRRHRLLIPDLPGHGESEPGQGPLEVGILLSGVLAVLDREAGQDGATVAGNSLGAWLACLAARERPGPVRRLVLVNGGPLQGSYSGPALQPRDRAEARRLMETLMGSQGRLVPWFVLDDVVRQARTGPIARLAATAGDMPRWVMTEADLGALSMPVDLVWGAEDGLFTLDYARRIQAACPRARLHPIPGCGHVPQRQCPRAFLEAFEEALEGGEDHAAR